MRKRITLLLLLFVLLFSLFILNIKKLAYYYYSSQPLQNFYYDEYTQIAYPKGVVISHITATTHVEGYFVSLCTIYSSSNYTPSDYAEKILINNSYWNKWAHDESEDVYIPIGIPNPNDTLNNSGKKNEAQDYTVWQKESEDQTREITVVSLDKRADNFCEKMISATYR